MNRITSIPRLSGGSMILGFVTMVPGALLYLSRPETGLSFVRRAIERGLLMAAVVITAIGLLLFAEYLRGRSAHAWALIGAYLYLFGAVLIVGVEATWLSGGDSTYAVVVTYVMLAFLGQAAVGLAVVQSGTLPPSVGWATIAWNLTWLVVLPLTTPGEIYFPGLHHMMPLVIGIAMIGDGGEKSAAQVPLTR